MVTIRNIVEAVEAILDGSLYKTTTGGETIELNRPGRKVEFSLGMARIFTAEIRKMEVDLQAATMFRPLCSCEAPAKPGNATFHSFKASGKWYATERGNLPESVFKAFDRDQRRRLIVEANGGTYPGLSGTGSDMTYLVFPDDSVSYGFPLMLYPAGFEHRTPPADFPGGAG